MAKTPYGSNTLAVTITDAKNYCKVTHNTDDNLFETLIRAAMQWIENFCDTTFTEDCGDTDEITDFFNDESLASKWSTGGTVSETDHPGGLVVASGSVEPAGMGGVWQHLTGNFDVRTHVRLPAGALAVSSGVMIVAKADDDNAVSVRFNRQAGGAYVFSRHDEVEGTQASNTSAEATMTDFHLRLRRSGGRFFAYAKQWNTDAWTEITEPAGSLLTSGPIELWLSAYHGTSFEAWFDYIIENSEYADWPLPYCFEGSSSGSGHRLWGECAEPICCWPLWIHPCTGETIDIPPAVIGAILGLVRRLYDNRGGVRQESVAGWAITWMDLNASDVALLLEQFRNVGV